MAILSACSRSPSGIYSRLANDAFEFEQHGVRCVVYHHMRFNIHDSDSERQLTDILRQADGIAMAFILDADPALWKDRRPTKLSHGHSQTSMSRSFYMKGGNAFVKEHFSEYDRQYDLDAVNHDWQVGISYFRRGTYPPSRLSEGPVIIFNAGFNELYVSMLLNERRVIDFVANDGF